MALFNVTVKYRFTDFATKRSKRLKTKHRSEKRSILVIDW